MPHLNPAGTVALVTGANRGIGRAFVSSLVARGALKVYAGTRSREAFADLRAIDPERVVPVRLDITDDEQVAEVAAQAGDVNLLVNNAGTALFKPALAEDSLAAARKEMEVNYFGTLRVSRAFAKTLASNGGGGIINIVSVGGVQNFPLAATYSASKAALHSATQALRFELGNQETVVVGVYPGAVDTDLAAGIQLDKDSPAFIADSALDALAEGVEDVYPGAMASGFQVALRQDPKQLERDVSKMARQILAGAAAS
jgi:short-subunit dehydrogenase